MKGRRKLRRGGHGKGMVGSREESGGGRGNDNAGWWIKDRLRKGKWRRGGDMETEWRVWSAEENVKWGVES